MLDVAPAKQASRYSHGPVLDKDREPKHIPPGKLTSEDIEAGLVIHGHLASIPYIAALRGRHEDALRKRLKLLKRPPNKYLVLCDEHRAKPKAYQNDYQIFKLTEPFLTELAERGIPLPPVFPRSNSLTHDILAHQVVMSLRIGAKQHPEVRYIGPEAILASEGTPSRIRDPKHAKTWYRFPIKLPGMQEQTICPDYFPIGIDRANKADADDQYIFLAIEADTGTESIPAYEYDHSRIVHKMLGWQYVLDHELEYKQLGLPNLYPTFIAATARRKESLKAAALKVLKKKWLPFFLLKSHPLTSSSEKPRPTGHMLEEDFERADLPNFNLLKS